MPPFTEMFEVAVDDYTDVAASTRLLGSNVRVVVLIKDCRASAGPVVGVRR
jgi:hypothetical protein